MRPAASGMFLIASRHVAGTHEAAFFVAAFADADAAEDGADKTVFLLGKMKVGLGLDRLKIFAHAQVVKNPVRVHYFPRIHPVLRIPDRFKFLESPDEFWTEHFRQQLGT